MTFQIYITKKDFENKIFLDKNFEKVLSDVKYYFTKKHSRDINFKTNIIEKKFYENDIEKIKSSKKLILIVGKNLWRQLGHTFLSFETHTLKNFIEKNDWKNNYYPVYYYNSPSLKRKHFERIAFHTNQTFLDIICLEKFF